jgi:hypothetical protein
VSFDRKEAHDGQLPSALAESGQAIQTFLTLDTDLVWKTMTSVKHN